MDGLRSTSAIPYMIEAGISSSDHIAKFFGLTDAPPKAPIKTIKTSRPIFTTLRKITRPHRIRAVRAWRDMVADIAKKLTAVGLRKAPTSQL
jgi:hypothetical protein